MGSVAQLVLGGVRGVANVDTTTKTRDTIIRQFRPTKLTKLTKEVQIFLLAKAPFVLYRVLLTHNTSTHYRSKRAHARHDKLKK